MRVSKNIDNRAEGASACNVIALIICICVYACVS